MSPDEGGDHAPVRRSERHGIMRTKVVDYRVWLGREIEIGGFLQHDEPAQWKRQRGSENALAGESCNLLA